jgi:hypothetical protein
MTYALVLVCFLIPSGAGKLLSQVPAQFASTNVVLISPEELTLPWRFSRASPAVGT